MTKKPIYLLSLAAAFALAVVSCENKTNFGFLSRTGQNPSGNGTDTPITPTNPDGLGFIRVETWTQPPASASKADLIFAVDTSGSLDDERVALTTALKGFLSTLASRDVDVCIGILLGHVGARAGKLYSTGDVAADKCLCVSAFAGNPGDLIAKFGSNVSSGPVETASDGGEAAFYSFLKSLTTEIANNAATGCYRMYNSQENVALIPIFLSDENEISTSPDTAVNDADCDAPSKGLQFSPQGPGTIRDSECDEPRARRDQYSSLDSATGKYKLKTEFTTQGLYNVARAFQGPLGFISETVGYTGAAIPGGGENEKAYGFIELSDLSGGDQIDLKLATDGNQAGFDAAFENLGETIADKVNLLTVFDLSAKGCAGTVGVKRDGTAIPFSFDGNKRVSINASVAGSAGSIIEITYEACKS